MNKSKPLLILLAGGSCSGKGSLISSFKNSYNFPITVIETDDHTVVRQQWKGKEIASGIDCSEEEETKDLFDKHIDLWIEMEEEWPDPKNVDQGKILTLVKKELDSDIQKVIFVEGLHALQNEELRNMADLKIYSHTDDDLRLVLKISRSPWYREKTGEPIKDTRNFGGCLYSLPFALSSWSRGTIKAEKKWVIPTQKYADLIIDYNESADLPKNAQLVSVIADLYFNNPQEFEAKMKWIRGRGLQKQGKEVFAKELKEDTESRRLDSLYELVKSIKQKKNRPLKIICDWDDCLQPVKTRAIYWYSPELRKAMTFEEFHDSFWEKAIINPTSVGGDKLHEEYEGSEEEKAALTKFEAERQARKANPELYAGSFYVSEERFNTPLTTLAKELLQAVKEGLVGELVIISSYRKTTTDGPKVQKFLEQERDLKKNKILKTFGQFPNCKLELTEVEKNPNNGKYKPFMWEIIEKNHPDFDIYMDDSARRIFSIVRSFSQGEGKTYIFPDYKCNRYVQASNIYHVKTTVSDLKDEDFTQAAEEYKQKHSALASRQAKQNQTTNNKQSIWKQPYFYLALGIGFVLLGAGIYWILRRKKNSKQV